MFRRNFRTILWIIVIVGNLIAFNNCTQAPQLQSTSASSIASQHSASLTSCLPCHTADRPGPTLGFVHYNNQDCITCHTTTYWTDHAWHTRNPAQPSCAQCHRKDQEAPVNGIVHYDNQDCVACHHAALTAGITFANTKAFAHSPVPTACANCHLKDKPTDSNHTGTQDCNSCHITTQW